MALSATLAELETWIRQDADMQAPDDRVTSEECRTRINRSLAQLYDRLVLVDQEYFLRGATVASNSSGKYDIMNDLQTGVVRSIQSISSSGSGYTNGAVVTLSQGSNATATGTITATGGALTGVTLTSAGYGYVDAAQTLPGYTLEATIPLPSPYFTGPGLVIGTKIYYMAQSVSSSDCYIQMVDTVAQTVTSSTLIGPDLRPVIAYHQTAGVISAVDASGNVYKINPTTLAWTQHVTGLPLFKEYGVFYDANTDRIYASDGADIFAMNENGIISGAVSPFGGVTSLLTLRVVGPQSELIFCAATTSDLYSVNLNTMTSSLITTLTFAATTATYASSSDRLYMNGVSGGYKAYTWDFGTSTETEITSTLAAVPGYISALGWITYDSASDKVWYSAFGQSLQSNVVVALTGATAAVDSYITVPDGCNFGVATAAPYVVVSGYSYFSVAPTDTSFFIYNASGGTALIPNYITLNVSGGTGGQVIAYIESDFYKCKGVWFTEGSGTEPDNGNWDPLRRFNWEAQNSLNKSSLYGGLTALPLYRIVTELNRDKMLISPDNIGGTFKLWYYPSPMKLLTPTDRFDGRAGWDEWIVKDVAIQLLMAEESVEQASALKVVRDEIWERLQLHAEDREAAQPQKIMDVTLLSRRARRWT